MNYLQALEKHLVPARNHTALSRTLFPEVMIAKKGRKINKFNKQQIRLSSVKAESLLHYPVYFSKFSKAKRPSAKSPHSHLPSMHLENTRIFPKLQSYNPKCIPLPDIRIPLTPLSEHADYLSEIDINFLHPLANII